MLIVCLFFLYINPNEQYALKINAIVLLHSPVGSVFYLFISHLILFLLNDNLIISLSL